MSETEATSERTVSKHAEKRLKGRQGIPIKAAKAQAVRAQEKGVHYQETKGDLLFYLKDRILAYGNTSDIYVFAEHVFVFETVKNSLVTTYKLPRHLIKLIPKSKSED